VELFPSQCGAEQKWLSFRCPDGQTVMAQFQLPQDQFVNVHFAGRELRLPHVISGSGARYSDGKTTRLHAGRKPTKLALRSSKICPEAGEEFSRSLKNVRNASSLGMNGKTSISTSLRSS
jgi:hypothetical protein